MGLAGAVALSVEHDGVVQAIAFSPDSTRFASGGGDSVLRVRAVGTGPPLDVASDGFVSSIAFSPDGSAFAVADFEQVFLRDSATGEARWQGRIQPSNSVNTVRFTADGKTVVAATDQLVALLDASNGDPGRRITVDRPLIADLDLSTDGTRIALAIDERHGGDHRFAGAARVVDLSTGTKLGELVPENAVFAVAFSPDGDMVLCCGADDTTRMFDAADGTQLWPDPEDAGEPVVTAPNCLAYDPKGKWTVVGGSDGFARILEAESGVENVRVPRLEPGAPDPGFGAVTHVAFSPNGKRAASACIDNVLRVFNVKSGTDHYLLRDTDEVLAMRFSPDGRWLGLACGSRALVLDNGEA